MLSAQGWEFQYSIGFAVNLVNFQTFVDERLSIQY
jgi:hypothetical protein